jgi:hypothetical protein
MNHQQYQDLLTLYLIDELDENDRRTIEQHLATCADCQSLRAELERLHAVVTEHALDEASDALLHGGRQQLHRSLVAVTRRGSVVRAFVEWLNNPIHPGVRIAFSRAAMLVVGVIAGYALFHRPAVQDRTPSSSGGAVATIDSSAEQTREAEPRITNIRFIDSDAADGEVEFSFDAVMPVRLKGSVNDPKIQRVLTQAMLNERNPGTRLRSVNAINTDSMLKPDRDVRDALILALKSDENPGVRREAARALQRFPFDDEIKRALLDVLMHDVNSALRVAAINALDAARSTYSSADEEVRNVLRQKIQSDDNDYVRFRSRTVLEEIKQQ